MVSLAPALAHQRAGVCAAARRSSSSGTQPGRHVLWLLVFGVNLRPAFAMPEVFAHASTCMHELAALPITGRQEGVFGFGFWRGGVVRQGLGVPQ